MARTRCACGTPRDRASLRARLGEGPLTVWAEDDILHVLWRGQADEVQLVAGLQPWLWPVQGTRDLVGGVASPLPAG
jgi:hypothetical protein